MLISFSLPLSLSLYSVSYSLILWLSLSLMFMLPLHTHIPLVIHCWCKSENYWPVKWRLTENAKYALDDAGITIPFPQLDIHTK